jgi:hypothetical protein
VDGREIQPLLLVEAGVMRYELSDDEWVTIKPMLPVTRESRATNERGD